MKSFLRWNSRNLTVSILISSLTGFDVHELDSLLRDPLDEERAEQAPPLPEVAVTRPGDLWLIGPHRVLCGDATSPEAVARLARRAQAVADGDGSALRNRTRFGVARPRWAERHGPAEPSYMKHRTEGHTETTISGDTRADWSEAFALVPSLEVAYVWHASKFTREVLDGLLRIGFLHHQQIIWNKGRTVLTRTHYWFQHEPCWYVRKKNAPWFGKAGENSTIWDSPSPKFIMGGSDEEKFDHPTQKPVELMRRPILNHTKRGELVYEPFLGSGTTLVAAELTERVCYGMELDPKYVRCDRPALAAAHGNQEAALDGTQRTFDEIAAERMALPSHESSDAAARSRKSEEALRAGHRDIAGHARRFGWSAERSSRQDADWSAEPETSITKRMEGGNDGTPEGKIDLGNSKSSAACSAPRRRSPPSSA